MSYGLSVFWLPLSKAMPGAAPAECKTWACWARCSRPPATGASAICSSLSPSASWCSACRPRCSAAGWSARARARPVSSRRSAGAAAFSSSALGVYSISSGSSGSVLGVIGGIGLGLGYISPVSTLVKWFPDRRGMATGMAIMGFGGGAMIGSPLANLLMNHFKTADSRRRVADHGDDGRRLFRLHDAPARSATACRPRAGDRPAGRRRRQGARDDHRGAVALEDAHKTPQFWLIWAVLCLNVSAGIGVLAMASPMLQEIFGGGLIGQPETGFSALDAGQQGRHRDDRRGLRRPAVAVQHRRPLLLGFAVGPHRPQDDLFRVLRHRHRALRARRRRSPIPGRRRCSSPRSASSCRCTAAASRRCRPISPIFSARASSARSTAGC